MKRITTLFLFICLFLCGCRAQVAPSQPVRKAAPEAPLHTMFIPAEPTPRPLEPIKLVSYRIKEENFAECSEPGTLVTAEYQTKDYVKGLEEPITKNLCIYLPYGYDEEKQYDVLFLMHTSGADENFWLKREMSYAYPDTGYITVCVKDLVDNMIQQGRCRPCILVAADGFINDNLRSVHDTSTAYTQFAYEFGEDIMPYVAENYATYAEGSDRASLSAAREHFGFLGASYGAYMCYLSILPDNLDIVANFAMSGGGSMDYNSLYKSWVAHGTENFPISYLYIGTGEFDERAGPEGAYLNFLSAPDRFSKDNLHFTLYEQTRHEPREWINSLYNVLQLFFR